MWLTIKTPLQHLLIPAGFIKFNNKTDVNKLAQWQTENIRIKYGNLNSQGFKKKDSIYMHQYVKLSTIRLIGLELNSPIVTVSSGYKRKNLVGIDFLKNFIVTIDWKHHELYLKPIKDASPASNFWAYGFECYRFDGVLKVIEMYNGSIAEKMGIKCGDEILEINNLAALGIEKKFLDAINSGLPDDHEITVKFKNREREIVFKKMKIF